MDAENKLTPEEYAAKFTADFKVENIEKHERNQYRWHFKATLYYQGRKILESPFNCSEASLIEDYESRFFYQGRMSLYADEVLNRIREDGVDTGESQFGHRRKVSKIKPSLTSFLACLASDFRAIDHGSFEDYCADYGANPDSIKELKAYEQSIRGALKFRAVMGEKGLQELHEVFENY